MIVVRERMLSKNFPKYMELRSSIIDSNPSSFEEETYQEVWRYAIVEEYTYVMRNDVWDIVLRQEGKSVVISRWLYNIKHPTNGSIEKFKVIFVLIVFS
jgi:hypothetical protein